MAMDRSILERGVKLLLFYVVFYLCLASIFAIFMVVLNETLDYYKPTYTLERSIIGTSPGMGFRPLPRANVYSSLIWFRHGQYGNWRDYTEDLETFLQPYYANEKPGEHVMTCKPNQPLPPIRVCAFTMEQISSNCTSSRMFGYDTGQPCILVKLNRIYGWEPEPYERRSFPKDLPQEIRRSYDPRYTYISCDGETDADRENIGPINYYPTNSIANYYYPFYNLEGYLSPFVFVHFLNPASGVLVSIECKAWAKNIVHNRMESQGSVHFELMVD